MKLSGLVIPNGIIILSRSTRTTKTTETIMTQKSKDSI